MANSPMRGVIRKIGPGVITGAADDDPSGIATYSQAGAQAGFGLLWTVVVTWPLMIAVQSVSARIGRVTGHGLAANMVRIFPRPVVSAAVIVLFVANTINIGADLSAMGAAMNLVVPWGRHWFTLGFALLSFLAIVLVPYSRYVGYLKWLTFSLLAYVGVVFSSQIDWRAVAIGAVIPRFALDGPTLMLIVAVLGTTISPYLFFWQSSQEVEDEEGDPAATPLVQCPDQAPRELRRIRWETGIGMGVSNLVAFFIMLTAAATLNAAGRTDVETAEQAAEALRPIAGEAAFLLFGLGIIGTGLLAVPVLAGSAAYALAEVMNWRTGLESRLRDAVPFYSAIGATIALGLAVDQLPIDPMKALLWSAVLNGVVVVPIIAAMLIVASRQEIMGAFTASIWQRVLGWATVAVMAAAAVGMFVLM